MAEETTRALQNRVRIGGIDYYFKVELVPVEGSQEPVASDALYRLTQQLTAVLNRGVAMPSQPHGRTWDSTNKKWIYQSNNDTSLITSEAVLNVLDYIRTNWIDKIVKAIYTLDTDNLLGDGITGYDLQKE